MKLLLFGDSLTFGYGVWEKDNIESLLKKEYPNLTIINKGINGNTTREAVERFERDVLSHNPHIITFLFGSNDSAMGDNCYRTLYEYNLNFEIMLEQLMAKNKNCKIILITPPPVDDTVFMPWNYNSRLLPYVENCINLSKKYNTYLIDINTHFKNAKNLEECLQEDGCHFSEQGYLLFFSHIKNTLDKILGEQPC
ncbi:MAG: SGNH/GDSL hydrolase family protein [Anaerotignaceae bacterium]